MKRLLPLLGAILIAPLMLSPAVAAENDGEDVVTHASFSLEECRRLLKHGVAHKPRDDVAFKPGVDVRGKAVVPAEGSQTLGKIEFPDEIVIDFGLDLAGRYGISGAGLFKATAGILTINYDLAAGGLTINGKRLNLDDSQAVKRACEMMLKAQGPEKTGK